MDISYFSPTKKAVAYATAKIKFIKTEISNLMLQQVFPLRVLLPREPLVHQLEHFVQQLLQ